MTLQSIESEEFLKMDARVRPAHDDSKWS